MGASMSAGERFEDTRHNAWRHDLEDDALCTMRSVVSLSALYTEYEESDGEDDIHLNNDRLPSEIGGAQTVELDRESPAMNWAEYPELAEEDFEEEEDDEEEQRRQQLVGEDGEGENAEKKERMAAIDEDIQKVEDSSVDSEKYKNVEYAFQRSRSASRSVSIVVDENYSPQRSPLPRSSSVLSNSGGETSSSRVLFDGAEYLEGEFEFREKDFFYRHLRVRSPKGVVFIVHGFAVSSFEFGSTAQHLRREHGLEVFAIDLYGHGRSVGNTPRKTRVATIEDWRSVVDLVCAFIVSKLELHATRFSTIPVFIFGMSMGGAITSIVSDRLKDRVTGGVILLCPMLKIPDLPPQWVLSILRAIGSLFPSIPLAKHRSDGYTSDPHKEKMIFTESMYYKIDGYVRSVTASNLLDMSLATLPLFGTFSLPFLAIHGSDDTYTDPNGTREFFEKSPLVAGKSKFLRIFEGAQHVLVMEKDEIVREMWEEVDRFICLRISEFHLGVDIETTERFFEEEKSTSSSVSGVSSSSEASSILHSSTPRNENEVNDDRFLDIALVENLPSSIDGSLMSDGVNSFMKSFSPTNASSNPDLVVDEALFYAS